MLSIDHKRKLFVGMLVLTIGLLSTNSPTLGETSTSTVPDDVEALAVDESVHNYNVCGIKCQSDNEAGWSADGAINLAVYLFIIDGAESLTLQEICLGQLSDGSSGIADRVGSPYAWVFVASLLEHPSCPPDTQGRRWFGNAILHRGSHTDFGAWYLSNLDNNCDDHNDHPTTECRTMICARVDLNASPERYGSCSAHFDKTSTALTHRQTQANEYAWVSSIYLGERTSWLNGDFNLEPHELPGIYDLPWFQLVQQFTEPAPNPNRQIDHMWVTNWGSARTRIDDCSWQTGASDHCYTSGAVLW